MAAFYRVRGSTYHDGNYSKSQAHYSGSFFIVALSTVLLDYRSIVHIK